MSFRHSFETESNDRRDGKRDGDKRREAQRRKAARAFKHAGRAFERD